METNDFAVILSAIGRHTRGETLEVQTLDYGRSLVVMQRTPSRIVRGVTAYWDCDVVSALAAIDAYFKDGSKDGTMLVLGTGVRMSDEDDK